MRAVVYHGVGDVRLDKVKDPKLKDKKDAVVRISATGICGTDLHMIRGTMPDMKSGTILGHEAVGVVEEVGKDVRNLTAGDRVVVASTVACGSCRYCREGIHSQCDSANPLGSSAGTAFLGGPVSSGGFHGLQAEYARVPYASVGCVKLPDEVTDEQALFLSDVFPTGYFAAELARVSAGDTVVVFGCGPVGQFAIASAKLKGAGRIFAVDRVPSRLDVAREQGAEVINFEEDDPMEALEGLTRGVGPNRAIDAVGVDAEPPEKGPAAKAAKKLRHEFHEEQKAVAPRTNPKGALWRPGAAPSQALAWAVQSLAKAGTLGIVGVYPMTARVFPIGMALQKNLEIRTGNCPHRRYIPHLLQLVRNGTVDPAAILSHVETLSSAIEAYKAFDLRRDGWIKVGLVPGLGRTATSPRNA